MRILFILTQSFELPVPLHELSLISFECLDAMATLAICTTSAEGLAAGQHLAEPLTKSLQRCGVRHGAECRFGWGVLSAVQNGRDGVRTKNKMTHYYCSRCNLLRAHAAPCAPCPRARMCGHAHPQKLRIPSKFNFAGGHVFSYSTNAGASLSEAATPSHYQDASDEEHCDDVGGESITCKI